MKMELLSKGERRARLVLLAAVGLGGLGLRIVDPTGVAWLPLLRPTCGAVTGLPCIFCGMTRAIHQLLNGNFAETLHFNWLAFPLMAAAAGLVVWTVSELILRRRLRPGLPPLRLTPRNATVGLALLMAIWLLQVSLAIGRHKHDLLNEHGLLYSLLVK